MISLLALVFTFICCAQEKDFSEEELNIPSEKVMVNGALVTPKGQNKKPLVIIIPGSGTVDRNGGTGNYLKQLAEGLAESNIASYRYDKSSIILSQKEGFKSSKLE